MSAAATPTRRAWSYSRACACARQGGKSERERGREESVLVRSIALYYMKPYVCMHACMYVVCNYVCTYVCMYACMHACMHVFMHVCMYSCMYVYIHTSTYTCIYAEKERETHTSAYDADVPAWRRARTPLPTQARRCTPPPLHCTDTCVCVCVCVCTDVYMTHSTYRYM